MLTKRRDSKAQFDHEQSVSMGQDANKYLFYGLVPFLLMYGLTWIDWSSLTVCLSIAVIVNCFCVLNNRRTLKAFRIEQ